MPLIWVLLEIKGVIFFKKKTKQTCKANLILLQRSFRKLKIARGTSFRPAGCPKAALNQGSSNKAKAIPGLKQGWGIMKFGLFYLIVCKLLEVSLWMQFFLSLVKQGKFTQMQINHPWIKQNAKATFKFFSIWEAAERAKACDKVTCFASTWKLSTAPWHFIKWPRMLTVEALLKTATAPDITWVCCEWRWSVEVDITNHKPTENKGSLLCQAAYRLLQIAIWQGKSCKPALMSQLDGPYSAWAHQCISHPVLFFEKFTDGIKIFFLHLPWLLSSR